MPLEQHERRTLVPDSGPSSILTPSSPLTRCRSARCPNTPRPRQSLALPCEHRARGQIHCRLRRLTVPRRLGQGISLGTTIASTRSRRVPAKRSSSPRRAPTALPDARPVDLTIRLGETDRATASIDHAFAPVRRSTRPAPAPVGQNPLPGPGRPEADPATRGRAPKIVGTPLAPLRSVTGLEIAKRAVPVPVRFRSGTEPTSYSGAPSRKAPKSSSNLRAILATDLSSQPIAITHVSAIGGYQGS